MLLFTADVDADDDIVRTSGEYCRRLPAGREENLNAAITSDDVVLPHKRKAANQIETAVDFMV
jgi:hypothetical protein